MQMQAPVTVIGGGLAGCEAAYYLAQHGIPVMLYEQKPNHFSPAHHSNGLAELVCSNSLKADRLSSASGLLKAEMRRFSSLLLQVAAQTSVPAGGALAVDREVFSALVTEKISTHPLITLVREAVDKIPTKGDVIIATGPLTDGPLAKEIEVLCGQSLSFFDAAAPIVTAESIDQTKVFAAARYDRGDPDYLNCPFTQEEYDAFYDALIGAQRAPLHDFEAANPAVYEGCMPVEVMATRGKDTLRYGPLRPVGLKDPNTGRRPWALVQLRAENKERTMYNLVGFQTNLKFGEQKRVFSMIPGLEHAEFVRYGVMHRNTFLNAPTLLSFDFSLRSDPRIFFAGQMTGVEGYMESAASGLLAAFALCRRRTGKKPLLLPQETMLGALSRHVSQAQTTDYQPMGANMGLLPPLPNRIKSKQERYEQVSARALAALDAALEEADAADTV